MSDIRRICAQCGASVPLNARYCGNCGYDFQGELPVAQSSLPAVVGKAAVPFLLGAASLALRLGWKVLQSRWAQAAAESAVDAALKKVQSAKVQPVPKPASVQPAPIQPAAPAEQSLAARARRTITIRSAWAVGDANGIWRQGFTEQRIDLDD
jgi:hypothetical protein